MAVAVRVGGPPVIGTQRRLRAGHPIWLPAASRRRRYPSLSERHSASVAIVGGGITGALVAYLFARAGVDVVLVEGGLVAQGSTAASSALLLQEPDLELTQLAARYGSRSARRIWALGHESVAGLADLLMQLRIRCDLKPRDAIYYALDAAGAARLRLEQKRRTQAGFDVDWLSPGALQRITGISGQGAIRSSGSMHFDPYRGCVGILRAAAAAGARIFEKSSVKRIDVESDGVRIRTARGSIEARKVIVATGYATPQFRPLAGRFRMYRTYVLVTKPMAARQRRELGLSDVMLWDTDRPYHYVRWTADGRLLFGGGDRRVRPGQRRRQQFESATRGVREFFESRWPALAGIETAAAWEGLFALTPDSLPYIGPHRRYPRHWFALGYGGNGMTFGFMAARMLLERWQGRNLRDHGLFEFGRGNRGRA